MPLCWLTVEAASLVLHHPSAQAIRVTTAKMYLGETAAEYRGLNPEQSSEVPHPGEQESPSSPPHETNNIRLMKVLLFCLWRFPL